MNTGLHWQHVIALVVLGLLTLGAIVEIAWPATRETIRQAKQRRDARIEAALAAHQATVNAIIGRARARGLYPDGGGTSRWPDVCSDPPCSPEDWWVCHAHRAAAMAGTQVISAEEWGEHITDAELWEQEFRH